MTQATSDAMTLEQPTPAPVCSHCGFSLPKHDGGLRHYGTHTAHQEYECLRLLHVEIQTLKSQLAAVTQERDRLSSCDKKAKDIPHFTLLGCDKLATICVEKWIALAKEFGVPEDKIAKANGSLLAMLKFQVEQPDKCKIPD